MTLGGIAGLIAAVAFVALVGMVAVPLWKTGRVLDELRRTVHDIGEESVPILTELQDTVRVTNGEIGRIGQQLSNPVAVALRNTLMRLTPPQVALRSMARHADWDAPMIPVGPNRSETVPPPTTGPPDPARR